MKQVINAAEVAEVQLLAENALEGGIYDADALQRMLLNSKHFDRCDSIATLQRAGASIGQDESYSHGEQAVRLLVERHMNPPLFLAASHTLHTWARQLSVAFHKIIESAFWARHSCSYMDMQDYSSTLEAIHV